MWKLRLRRMGFLLCVIDAHAGKFKKVSMCKRVAGSGLGLGLFEPKLHVGQSCCRRLVRAKVKPVRGVAYVLPDLSILHAACPSGLNMRFYDLSLA
eukprot:334064-Pelagomonas_calceolata.AAC.1